MASGHRTPPTTQISVHPTTSDGPTQYQAGYKPHHLPRQPPVAYQGHMWERHDTFRSDCRKDQHSFSSGTSSTESTHRPYRSPDPYKMGSQAERGLMHSSSAHHSARGSQTRIEISGNIRGSPEMREDNSAVLRYIQEKQEQEAAEAKQEKDHAIWVLIWLSVFDPMHSMFSALFTLITAIMFAFVAPMSICRPQFKPSTIFIRLVAPVFRHHLHMMCAPSVENVHAFDFKPIRLIVVHLISPILSVGIAIISWIAAAFWLFALIMGNPDGTEKRDDGRATILSIRNWWEKFLLYAVIQ